LKKANEQKKLREKLEREGKGFSLENNTDERFMTEHQIFCKNLDLKQETEP
jgi:hypothetical protein